MVVQGGANTPGYGEAEEGKVVALSHQDMAIVRFSTA